MLTDSMQVRAMKRVPGTRSYWIYDRKVLHSNVMTTNGPFDVWTHVRLSGGGSNIQWVWFDGHLAIDNLRITRSRPDTTFRISVSCTPSPVVRAGTATCSAAWLPNTIPASEIMFDWRFEGDSVRVFPAATAQPYPPPPPVDSAGQGMSSWSGPVVLGGKVSVRATFQGEVETDTAGLVVAARTDSRFGDLPVAFDPAMADIDTDSTTTLTNQPNPDGIGSLGVAGQNYDTYTRNGNVANAIRGWPTLASVPSGPNRGLWYVLDPGMLSTRGARIRTWLSGRSTPKFNYALSPTPLTNRGLLAARRKNLNSNQAMHTDSAAFLNGVWAHETYGANGRRGHQGQIELAAKSLPTCGRVPEIMERVVAADSNAALFGAVEVLEEGKKSLYAASGHNFVYGNHGGGPYYEVVPVMTVANNLAWKVALGDAQQSAVPSLAPDPRFDCTRVY